MMGHLPMAHLPGDSFVVPFWLRPAFSLEIAKCSTIRGTTLHRSLQVEAPFPTYWVTVFGVTVKCSESIYNPGTYYLGRWAARARRLVLHILSGSG